MKKNVVIGVLGWLLFSIGVQSVLKQWANVNNSFDEEEHDEEEHDHHFSSPEPQKITITGRPDNPELN